MCVSVEGCCISACLSAGAESDIRFPGAEFSSELPDVHPGSQTQVLCKHSTYSTAKPFLQPLMCIKYTLYLNAYLLLNV